ncbi:MAG TPA: acyl-CoA dehydrogenase family protein [Solirubrobacteraceae bacterium]|jgi:alkylation response protein AidB-like acyl-CoA dehydrogenase|nr:acyl-CoA dehydrogenase family protein [Solirubrobacteraceae bacterium]
MSGSAAAPSHEFVPPELRATVERAAELARADADACERARALTPALVEELRATGLMRAGAPSALGALEAPPAAILGAAESIAAGDASAGWCVSIAATSSLLSAYLPELGAEEVFGDPSSIAAGVWAPRGRAVPADGGVRVSGRWSFCSGISHSRWLFAGCVLDDGRADADGPALRVVGIPVAELEVLDTWHTSGLRATASHDALAHDVLVPEHRILSLMDGGPRVDAPLYRFPIFGFFALSIAAAALGNARGAISDLVELAGAKTAQGSSRVLAERQATQAGVAEAEARLRAARALYYEAILQAWGAAQSDRQVGEQLRLGLRLAATHAVRSSAEVARSMYDLGGGSAIYDDSPLQRRFRDAHAATAHFQVNPATWELAGRLLLGLPTRTAQL